MSASKKLSTRNIVIGVGALAILGGIAAVAGPRIYRDLIVGEQPEAPSLSTKPQSGNGDEPLAETGTDDDGTGTWSVTGDSFAGYRVAEVLNGVDVTVVGRTADVTGTVTIDAGTLAKGSVTVDLTTVATDESRRDQYFRSRALHTDDNPTATFTLTEPVEAIADAVRSGSHTVDLTGDLLINGVTRSVTTQLQAAPEAGGGVEVAGSIPLTFEDFDVTPPNLGFVKVEDHGTIEVSLHFARE